MKKILQYGSRVLEQRAEEVSNPTDPKILKLIDEMLKILDKEQDHSAGLSAPQVGESLRVAICRRVDIEELENKKLKDSGKKGRVEPIWEIMINPVITSKSEDTSTYWEGCLSINEGDLFGKVTRPKKITVEFTNLEGKKEIIEADEYFSHVVQHEIDHLDGVLFLKYVKDPSMLYTADELDALDD